MIDCPHCDYQAPDRNALIGHVNAKLDHPNWPEVREELYAGEDEDDQNEEEDEATEQGDEQADEGENSLSDEDDPRESSEEQAENGEDNENEQADEGANEQEDMVSQKELDKQRPTTGESSGKDQQTAPTLDTPETTSQPRGNSMGKIPLPVPRSWLFALIALGALGLVGVWVMQGDSSDDQEEPADEETGDLDDELEELFE